MNYKKILFFTLVIASLNMQADNPFSDIANAATGIVEESAVIAGAAVGTATTPLRGYYENPVRGRQPLEGTTQTAPVKTKVFRRNPGNAPQEIN